MSFDEKCNRCSNKPEFYVMLEDDDWPKHHIEQLCADCAHKLTSIVIEAWTEKEWDE